MRLLAGDPLSLRSRACVRLRNQHRILAPQRLIRQTAARVEFRGCSWTGKPPLDVWIARCVNEAILDCLEADDEDERDRVAITELNAPSYAVMRELLGHETPLTRLAMLTFNRLPPAVRQVCFRTIVCGDSLDRCVRDGLGDLESLKRRSARGLRALSDLVPGRPPAPSEDEYDDSSANDTP